MVDWFLAEKLATFVAGHPDVERPVPGDLAEMAADAAERVAAYTQLSPSRPIPPPEPIDRGEWVKANLEGMEKLLGPVLDKAAGKGPLRPAIRIVAGAAVTLEVGVLLGFMAQRVLGQYELVLLEPAESRDPRLLFVAPNLGEAVRSFDVPGEEFVRWVTLHEVTHAVQFAGVPWLQPHLAGLVETLLSAAELRLDRDRKGKNGSSGFSLPSGDEIRRMLDHLRRGDVISMVTRADERDTLDRVQATMAVVEGHAEHVMDAVGKEVLPSLPALRRSMEERRGSSSGVARVLAKVLGLEMKLKQYAMGKAFCDAVVEAGGIERLNVVWESPEMLPSAHELEHPDDWLARTSRKELDRAV